MFDSVFDFTGIHPYATYATLREYALRKGFSPGILIKPAHKSEKGRFSARKPQLQ